MIDFACKKFDMNEIIKCSLGLAKADFIILNFFMRCKESLTTDEISEKTGLQLSTVQRSVKRLHEKKVLKRMQNNLGGGGYVFVYSIENKSSIKKIISETVHNWSKKVDSELERW